jgi:hypothetical protein
VSQETLSQEYETNYDEANLDLGDERFMDATPRGRTTNYATVED